MQASFARPEERYTNDQEMTRVSRFGARETGLQPALSASLTRASAKSPSRPATRVRAEGPVVGSTGPGALTRATPSGRSRADFSEVGPASQRPRVLATRKFFHRRRARRARLSPRSGDGGKISPLAIKRPTGVVSATEGSANRAFAGVKTPPTLSAAARRGRAQTVTRNASTGSGSDRPYVRPPRARQGPRPRFWDFLAPKSPKKPQNHPYCHNFGPKISTEILGPKL